MIWDLFNITTTKEISFFMALFMFALAFLFYILYKRCDK